MEHAKGDRTGEICPICNKGKLKPTGYYSEEHYSGVESGEQGRTERVYVCDNDNCSRTSKGFVLMLRDTLRH